MPQTLRGSLEQALRPLPSVVKGVQACRLPGLKCLKRCAAASSRHSGHCPLLLRAFKPIANTTHLRLFARLTNTIKCGLWPCMFCLECIFLFPSRAGHALPRLLRLEVSTNAFFAYSRRICAFPSTSRECRRRLCFIAFFALSFVSVFRSQRAPIHFSPPQNRNSNSRPTFAPF